MAPTLSLKLLVNKNTGEVLFGEAKKDFVDFLFSLLAFPIGSVAKLLAKEYTVGCTESLYDSLENLDDEYMQPKFDKNTLLKPKIYNPISGPDPLLLLQGGASTASKYYTCGYSYSHRFVTDVEGVGCPSCNTRMTAEVVYVGPRVVASGSDGGGGCVKGVVTYMVMDDLAVKPMSTISGIALLAKFQVKDVSALEEKVVEVGFDEGLALLRASLESKTALNDIFGVKSEKVHVV
ncbi:uncharacterized protein LOC131243595 [Magnolia sinica]|uniref:uncharacterized protein LOC131243595 n=1 Tax=Magnolia sinica TaxID=86752 RepID=UPI00265A7BDA|nr:uncharacterized protein LOC131243595 [Magnolia sinica]